MCIAVLARVTPTGKSEPSHVGLAHVWKKPNIVSDLLTSVDLVTKGGKIEVFITGGWPDEDATEKNYLCIKKIIENLKNKMQIEIVDDQINAAGIETIVYADYARTPTSGLHAGFDQNANPYAVMTLEINDFQGHDLSEITQLKWKKNGQFIDHIPKIGKKTLLKNEEKVEVNSIWTRLDKAFHTGLNFLRKYSY